MTSTCAFKYMFKWRYVLAVAAFVTVAPTSSLAADHAVAVMYHRFGEDSYPSTNTTLAQLDAHILHIKAGGFKVLPLRQIVETLRSGEPLPDKTIAITIDDAYASVMKYGLPRLKEAGFTATLFVSTQPLDAKLPGYMTWDDIRLAIQMGFDIGAHTASHAHLADQSLTEARLEIDESNKRYEAELGFVPQLFAYPYGEASLSVRSAVKAAGYRAGFGQHSGVLHNSDDMFYLPRFALNETYGAIDRFRTLASAIPLMVTDITPPDMTISPDSNPPAFGFTVDPSIGSLSTLACYASGIGRLNLNHLGQRRIEARLPGRLSPGRHRVNCTLPGGGGRWRWFGRQFYVR
jgi:peptidoglycan/xylan/chitin deacetylase (PgdA/CDA1 family)